MSIWLTKPPPGTRLTAIGGEPNIIAAPFNEGTFNRLAGSYDIRIYNYANNGQGGVAVPNPIFIANGIFNSGVIKIGKNGPRVRNTATGDHLATPAMVTGDLWLPTTAVTILIGYRKTDATLRASAAFGTNSASHLGTHLPYSDGIVYWDWQNNSTGRLSVSGLTFGDDTWAFTYGPKRGQEIWQNGILRANNAGHTGLTRTNSATDIFELFNQSDASTTGDLAEYDFFYMWNYEIPTAQIQYLSKFPFSIFRKSKSKLFGVTGAVGLTEHVTDDQSGNWLDVASFRVIIPKTVSDNQGGNWADSLPTFPLGIAEVESDSITFSDTESSSYTYLPTAADDQSPNWADAIQLGYGLILGDTISLSDFARVPIFTDSISLVDFATLLLTLPVTVADALSILDNVNIGLNFPLSAADSQAANWADFISNLNLGLTIKPSDSFAFSDSSSRAAIVSRRAVDNVLFSDFAKIQLSQPSFSDAFLPTDSSSFVLTALVSKADSLSFSDSASVSVGNAVPLTDYLRRYLNDVID